MEEGEGKSCKPDSQTILQKWNLPARDYSLKERTSGVEEALGESNTMWLRSRKRKYLPYVTRSVKAQTRTVLVGSLVFLQLELWRLSWVGSRGYEGTYFCKFLWRRVLTQIPHGKGGPALVATVVCFSYLSG